MKIWLEIMIARNYNTHISEFQSLLDFLPSHQYASRTYGYKYTGQSLSQTEKFLGLKSSVIMKEKEGKNVKIFKLDLTTAE